MNRVVSNTGLLLHLLEADLIWILQKVGGVSIPSNVLAELQGSGYASVPDWIMVERLSPSVNDACERLSLSGMLDAGEAAAIIPAQRLTPDWFLTTAPQNKGACYSFVPSPPFSGERVRVRWL